jgi:lipoyl(octanoyl) transferase
MHQRNKQKNMEMPATTIERQTSRGLTPYAEALEVMQDRVSGIIEGSSADLIWFLEHPPTYTAGRSADMADVLDIGSTPLFHVERGGRVTYHGPGQLVGYVMLDLKKYKKDVRQFVQALEQWVIKSLSDFGIVGERRPGRIGIWTLDPKTGEEKKIAALGLKLKKWVSYHGFAINVDPDLGAFQKIVPCGIKEYGVTSFAELGKPISMNDLRKAMEARASDFLRSIST